MKLVRTKTPHPCAGMTSAQRRDFELIAIGQRPRGGHMTINKLKARGLIEEDAPEVVGRDRFGLIKIPRWYVPMKFHMQWCRWADEQERMRGRQ